MVALINLSLFNITSLFIFRYLLGIQSFTALVLALWSFCTTYVMLWIIDKFIPIRMNPVEEVLGADLIEHRIHHKNVR
jgi:Amt family ammonium transporter